MDMEVVFFYRNLQTLILGDLQSEIIKGAVTAG